LSYWICQLGGWGLFTLVKIFAAIEVADAPWLSTTVSFVLLHGAGLGLTHALRDFMRRHHWSESGTRALVWRGVAASFILATPLALATSLSPVGMAQGPAAGLALVDALAGDASLRAYPYLSAARGDLLERLGRLDEARAAFTHAASLTGNTRDRDVLLARARRAG